MPINHQLQISVLTMRGKTILSSLLLMLSAMPAHCDDNIPADSIWRNVDLEQVVVTGTRTPKLLAQTPVLTQVISQKDIQKADATDLKDLLQQVMPGVEFSYAMNQQVHLNLSGFGGQNVLILVDGERLAGETMDNVDFARIGMDNVDHIEIVKGAASALYGSNANGGVVNIITKKATRKFAMNVNGRWGKHGEQRYRLAWLQGGRKWNNHFALVKNKTDNYDVHGGDNPVTRVVTTIYGDNVWSAKNKLTYKPSENLLLSARAGYFFRSLVREADIPEHYRAFSGGLSSEWNLGKGGQLTANYAFDQYDKSIYQTKNKLDIRNYSNVQNSVRLLYTLNLRGEDVLSAGADYMHDYILNTHLEGKERKQDAFDAFVQYDWNIDKAWELVGALRYDFFSDHNISQLTPKINLRYTPIRNFNIRLGYGMGFRAPTLKEKYYNFDMSGIWIVEGNQNLKAEHSHNFNLSAEYTKGRYTLTTSGYYNYVTNKIATGAPYYADAADKQPRLPYINLANYNVTGFDATIQARWCNGISVRLSYAYVNELLPKDKDGNTINNQYIPARKHSLTAHADWDHTFTGNYAINIGLDGRCLSAVDSKEYVNYYDISKGTANIHYPAYSLWKLSMTHRIGKAFKVTTTIDNLLNYKPEYYYLNCPLTDGMSLIIGLSVDIDKLF